MVVLTKLFPRRAAAADARYDGEPRRDSAAPVPPGEPAVSALPAHASHKRKHSDVLELDLVAGLGLPAAPADAAAEDAGDDPGTRRRLPRFLTPCGLAALAVLVVAAAALRARRAGSGDGDARSPDASPSRIIGGRASLGGQRSYMVSLMDDTGRHFCAGTLVSKDAVLTAAHCTSAATGLGPITAVVGRQRLSDETQGEEIRVRQEQAHPRYDPSASGTQRSDFALLFLQRPTTTRAKIVKLNQEAEQPRIGQSVIVSGWGDTDPAEDVRRPADTLQEAKLRLISNDECNDSEGAVEGVFETYSLSYRGYIREDMMCARHRRRDSCQGDSGGPLLTFGGKQVGITSWGVGCNHAQFPGVYARVSAAFDWVQRNVCALSMWPDRQFKCKENEPW